MADTVPVTAIPDDEQLRTLVEDYLATGLGVAVKLSPLKRYPSGFSWLTYGFTITPPVPPGIAAELVLRLGPSNGLYAPYSAAPQFNALKTLEGTAVPVPQAYFWSDDPAILGAPFFIAEKVAGNTPIPWGNEAMAPDFRQSLGVQFAEALGALHAVRWEDSPLAALGDGHTVENTALKQVEAWERDYRQWALQPYPMVHYAMSWLRANRPVAPRLAIVHGDYRLGNFLEVDGRITAILDWELVHIGDPHEDFAWAALPQFRGGTNLVSKLLEREEFIRLHEAKSGIRLNDESSRYYEIFSLVKLAITHMAAVYAFERKGFHDMRMPAMGTQIAPVLRQIEKVLEAA